MNTTAKALAFAIVTVASAASIGMGMADRTTQSQTKIVKLERVVVIGKRAETPAVAQLPRVVIIGRSSAHDEVQLAAANPPASAI